MPRNSSGVMSSPAGTTPTPGTDADANKMASLIQDINSELTGSLPTNGVAPMTGPLLSSSGVVAAPGYSWANELGSGWYRAGAGDFRYAVSGADVLKVSSAGLEVTGTFTGTLAAGSVTPPKLALGTWTSVA